MSVKKKDDNTSNIHKPFVKKPLGNDEQNGSSSHEKKKEKKEKHERRKEQGDEGSSPKGTTERIDRELQQIYENSDGSMPDMRQFEKRKRSRLFTAFTTLILACLLLIGVAWAGFFLFQPGTSFHEEDVIVSVSGEEAATIGSPVTYRIRYRNDQHIPLSKAVVEIRYPDGFVFTSSSIPATDESHTQWALGTIDADESGLIDISGYLFGNVGDRRSFRVFLNYTPANFSSEFQKVVSMNVEMSGSPLDLVVTGPTEIVSGAPTQFRVTVKKKEGVVAEMLPLSLVLRAPAHFSKKESVPVSDQYEQFRWSIKNMDKEYGLNVTGVFASSTVGEKSDLVFDVVGKKPGEGDEYIFAHITHPVTVIERQVVARIVVNGTMGDMTVVPGETLHGSIVLENTGDQPMKQVRIRAVFDAPSWKNKSLIDWANIKDTFDGTVTGEQLTDDMRRGTILWDGSHIPALKNVQKGQPITIDFSLPLKLVTDDNTFSTVSSSVILAAVEIQYDGVNGKELFRGNQLNLSVVSDTALAVEDDVSTVGGKTLHTVTWMLSNSFHEIRNITLEADIYGDVTWEEKALTVPAGKATFDPLKKKLVWTIDRMPTSVDVLVLQFGVTVNTVNPSQTQLISKVKGQATDVVSGKNIVLVGDEILFAHD
ncbi:MAG TPA: hypothetical protein VEA18_02420 [Candidatus Kapabacteria bacterium]|nr:hypothetical protein [Candidatus Kapabacteria bacterium]